MSGSYNYDLEGLACLTELRVIFEGIYPSAWDIASKRQDVTVVLLNLKAPTIRSILTGKENELFPKILMVFQFHP